MERSAYFTTIDMFWGIYQLPTDIKTRNLTAFSTPFGSFKWLRMRMGLTGCPNTFQSPMERVLMSLTWKITPTWMIASFQKRQNTSNVRKVSLSKSDKLCEFFRTRVPFLGQIVSKNGLEANPEKVKALTDFPIPTSPTEVESFLGPCSYRRYVKKFADIAGPLHKASDSKSPFLWTPEAQIAFEALKQKLCPRPF